MNFHRSQNLLDRKDPPRGLGKFYGEENSGRTGSKRREEGKSKLNTFFAPFDGQRLPSPCGSSNHSKVRHSHRIVPSALRSPGQPLHPPDSSTKGQSSSSNLGRTSSASPSCSLPPSSLTCLEIPFVCGSGPLHCFLSEGLGRGSLPLSPSPSLVVAWARVFCPFPPKKRNATWFVRGY